MAAARGGPPSRLEDLSTAPRVLRRSLSTLASPSVLPALLAAALLLLTFRSALLAATLSLSSLADRDPHLRLLLSRLSLPPNPQPQPQPHPHPHPHPPPPPTRPSRDLDLSNPFFSSSKPPLLPFNASSSPLLFLGPTPPTLHPGIRRRYQRFKPSDPAAAPVLFLLDENHDRGRGGDRVLVRGLDLDRREAVAVLYLLSLLSSTHSLAILGFILSYSLALGIIFFAVAASHLGRHSALSDTLYSGARLGVLRLMGFVFLKWAARDALAQFLCIVFLSEIADQGRLFKLFVKVKFMPFLLTTSSPFGSFSGAPDAELTEFFFVWVFLDTMLTVLFVFVPWVMVMDRDVRRRGRDVVREGLFLVNLVPTQSFQIKLLETAVCGSMGSLLLTKIGGRMFTMVLQSVAEVYFMVAWLVMYFGARCKEGELEGRRFGMEDLEDGINGIR